MDENIDVTVSIAEANNSLQLQYGGMDAVKANTRQLFGSASLILSLVTILTINRVVPESLFYIYVGALVIAAILYVVIVTLCIYILSPVVVKTPIEPSLEVYQEYLLQKEGRELQLQRLSAYLNAVNLNGPIIAKRVRLFRVASILFVFLIVYLMAVSVIPSIPM